jgi:hypothetical protein
MVMLVGAAERQVQAPLRAGSRARGKEVGRVQTCVDPPGFRGGDAAGTRVNDGTC